MMKKQYFYLMFTILPALTMCHNENSGKKANRDLSGFKTIHQCYIAVDKKDTAFLNLLTYGKEKVKGHLLIRYSGKPKNEGNFTGQFKGDTLFLDYHFYIGADSLRKFTNPLALRKKQDSLILGVGNIVNNLGRSYFDKHTPISFEKGKFHFGRINCK
jgi:hypothetical protein